IKNELGVTLVPSTTYQYQFHVTVDGSNYYSDVYHLTTKGTASNTPVVSMLPTDAEEYRAKEFITETNACVVTKIIKKAGSHISRSGVTLYDEYGSLITDHWDNVNNVRDTTTTFHSWYDFNAELGVTLRPYTVYQYRFHVTVDGSDYYGETYRFTTAGEPPRPSNAWISADRKDLQAGTSVLLRFGADNATHYSLLLEHNETGYSSEIIVDGMNEYTMLLTDEGSYAAKLRAYNDNGYESVSPVLRLNVAPSLGYPVLILNRTELPLSEELTVNYKTEGAVSSTLKVFSDNALLTSFELGADGEISLQFYEPGEYVLVLSAQDGFGGSIDGTPVYCSLLPANTNTLLEGRFIPMRSYRSGHFTDVTPNHWFEQNVSCAYELGLMEGTSNNLFKPLGNVTLAQAIAMAARLHNIYEGGSGKFSEGTVWYEVYVNYALDNGIIKSSDFDAGTIGKTVYNRYATRAEMAYIFSNALPEEALPAINSISAIPDVTAGNQYYIQILRFYEAGIVEGGNGHRYYPENNITRAEAAAIISRMALPELRLEFSL
ncbi:MAG: S-layer homology domain-containing protein, partial [Firmicutes bacterium]|nr:S-layer homology domain-containing protein [Bacillota bacterium]